MSAHQFPKSSGTNESSIPISKRSNIKIKQSKRCAQLPELHRYIETIIKASEDRDSEDTSTSEKDKFPKERKYTGCSIYKKLESKMQKDKIKNDTRSRNISKSKTLISDVVSRGDKIYKTFVSEFEDPRNWNNPKNLSPSIEIEKFLKKFYPNPYHLNEIKNLKYEKDYARDGTLPDVVISNIHTDREVDSENTDNDTVIADNEIDACKRGIGHKNLSSDSKSNKNSTTYSVPGLSMKSSYRKLKMYDSSSSSRVGSFENLGGMYKECYLNIQKRKTHTSSTKCSSSQSDYDIGKLELINTTDSDEVMQRIEEPESLRTDDSNDLLQANSLTSMNLEDMKEIYKEITKITESFQLVNSEHESELKNINKYFNEIIKEEGAKEEKKLQTQKQTPSSITFKKGETSTKTSLTSISPAEKMLNELVPNDKLIVLDLQHEDDVICSEMDEVLEFMHNCLRNFNMKKKLTFQEVKQPLSDEEPTTSCQSEPETLTKDDLTENPFQIKEEEELQSVMPTESPQLIQQDSTTPSENLQTEPVPEVILPEPNLENFSIPTVEIQNELGSYSEITIPPSCSSLNAKSLLPLPVKLRKSNIDTCRTLKKILTVEEQMLLEPEESSKHVIEKMEGQVLILNDSSVNALPSMREFNNQSSNLLICINPLSQYLRCMNSIKPTIPLPAPISTNEVNVLISSKQIMFPTSSLEKLPPPSKDSNGASKRMYGLKQELIVTVNKPAVAYTARPVGLKAVTSHSKSTEEFSIKSSERHLQILTKPDSDNLRTDKRPKVSTSKSKLKPDKILIKETDEGFSDRNTDSKDNLVLKNSDLIGKLTETDINKDNYRKKVHELLLRAFSLQKKLQRYLQIMTHLESTSEQDEKVFGAVRNKIKNELNLKPEYSLPLVHWHLKPSVKSNVNELLVVSKVDNGTTYDPPMQTSEQAGKMNDGKSNKSEKNDEEDDESSNNSFKSSNDVSESSANLLSKTDGGVSQKQFIKKIYNEIESYRQSTTKNQEEQKKEESKEKSIKWLNDSQLAQCELKTPAKVLKTVFKGKKSSTELTIGLKDVPITKVGNISVEKTKFSPNHTKISICISQDNSMETHKNFSSYIFDRMRPSLSTCLTDYSRLNDELSKCSQSPTEESEDDEEDYKSVGSSVADSDGEEKKPETKEKTVEINPPKSFTKHRFDFYRKMNLDSESSKSKNNSLINSVCRYKELEPLKQALTEMQIRMRSIKRDSTFNSCDYYERALKLAKMSAGFCQNCGNRAVIPNDTFGYYRSLFPQKAVTSRRIHNLRPTITSKPSIYSFRSNNAELNHTFCDMNVKPSSCSLHPTVHSNRTIMRSSLHDMPILFEGM